MAEFTVEGNALEAAPLNTFANKLPADAEAGPGFFPNRPGSSIFWLCDAGSRTWAEFQSAVEGLRLRCVESGVKPGDLVVTPGEAKLESLAWLFALAELRAVAVPLRKQRRGEMAGWSEAISIKWLVEENVLMRRETGNLPASPDPLLRTLEERGHAGLVLATGGTTGGVKLVLHDLNVMLDSMQATVGRPWRTLPLMRFDHIGGLDMALRAAAEGQVLVQPPEDLNPEAVACCIERHSVEVMPATPSFLNLLLIAGAADRHDLRSLRVVPFGAEPMPDGLLERLHRQFPDVKFTQRYGTSETGALPVRPMGNALVLNRKFGHDWKVEEGVLWVRSPARGLGYLVGGDNRKFASGGWFCTGDLVEERTDGSLRVLGRREELINVGGEKVLPSAVEAVLSRHPSVADCRVLPLSNAILGQIVAVELVWTGIERDPVTIKRQLHEFAATSLPKFHLPAVVRLVESIETGRNLKKSRTTP